MAAGQGSITPIEVEHKFLIPDDIESRLMNINAKFVKEITFTDVYLDTPENTLALSDTWLRRRDGCYQLKYAPSSRVESVVGQYSETDDELNIRQRVGAVLTDRVSDTEYDLESLVSYAEITTHRRKYQLGNVVIDLDSTDFGYNIGEVEVMAARSADVQDAVSDVDRIISLLGVETASRTDGKLIYYLSSRNSDLRSKILVRLGI